MVGAEEFRRPLPEALGAMGECVMSLYGIVRLLRSRDLGASQLAPAVEAFGAGVHEQCELVGSCFADLRVEARRHAAEFDDAFQRLEDHHHKLAEAALKAFSLKRKLGARSRLAIEREAERIGQEMQSLRSLTETVCACVHPRPTTITLTELLYHRWRPPPAFVAHRVEVVVPLDNHQRFVAEPTVLWSLLEDALCTMHCAGLERPTAKVETSPGQLSIFVGDVEGDGLRTVEHVFVEVGPRLGELETAILAIAGRAVAIQCGVDDSRTVAELRLTLG